MTSSPAAIIRLPKSLKLAAAATGVVAAVDVVAIVAWAAGAPSAVVIPIWVGLLLAAMTVARRHRCLPRLGPKR